MAKNASFGGAAAKGPGFSRQGSLWLEIANAREAAKRKENHQATSAAVKAERDAAYRLQLENQKRIDDFKKELEKDLGPIENSIRHCRRLYDDY